ncbi:restriction endonuclease subunit S [Plesiomonas shigelloides]|uniref:restriction endonuclease subunit S n=1 Tax=Plesiomonas shigelloides TaxID=703 RepID=UPI0015B50ECF|nr:restriction endonuclease subunit S [Plesiomonas shigelloides]
MVHDLAISAIPPHWTVTTLGQYLDINGGTIQTGPFGSQLHASDYVEQGIPSVMPKNITVEKIDDSDIARISVEDAERLSKYLLQSGDIIYSRRGDVEKCSLVTDVENGWLCGTGCLRVRLNCEDKDKLSKFLHAYLSSPMIREWISRNAVGATMPNLNTSILRDVPLIIPEPYKIDFIGSMWTRFNNKITLNRQINQTLEQMAQALFKSWFVDFDPVIDNALDAGFFDQNSDLPEELLRRAEQRKIVRVQSDFKPLPAETRQLFPAAFEECEEPSLGLGGWVPKGWEAKSIGSVSKFVKGKSYKSSELATSDTALVTLKSFKRGGGYRLDGLKPYIGSYKTEQVVSAGDLIIACTDVTQAADIIGKPAIVISDTNHKTLIISLDVSVVRPYKVNLKYYLYGLAKTLEFQSHTYAHSTGTTVLHLSKDAVPAFMFSSPSDKTLELYHEIVSPFFDIIEKNNCSSRTLANLRNTLLPKLISGELRLNDDGTLTDENTDC